MSWGKRPSRRAQGWAGETSQAPVPAAHGGAGEMKTSDGLGSAAQGGRWDR